MSQERTSSGQLPSSLAGEAPFQRLIDSSLDGVVVIGEDDRIAFLNTCMATMLGYTVEEMRGRPIQEFIPGEASQREAFERQAHRKTGLEQLFEFQGHRRDGSVVWMLVSSLPLHDDTGRCTGTLAIVNDITEAKAKEATLQAQLQRIEHLNAISRLIEQTLDLDTLLDTLVEKIMAIFGADRVYMLYPCNPAAEVVRVPIERNRPEYPGAFASNTELPMNPGGAQVMRDALGSDMPVAYGPGGRPFPEDQGVLDRFSVRSQLAVAIRPKIGQPWLLGLHQCAYARQWTAEERQTLKDIALRMADAFSNVLFHQALKRSEARYRTVIDTIREVILQADAQGRLVFLNPAWETLSGRAIADSLGTDWVAALHPDDQPALRAELEALLAGRTPQVRFEARLVTPTGALRWIEGDVQPAAPDQGEGAAHTATLRDVTERKQAEQVRSELEAARELDRLKTIFVNAISHDLRTPLTSIRGYAEFLEDELSGPLGPQQHEYVRQIQRSSLRLQYLVDDLLDFARMEAGSFQLKLEEGDFTEAVRETLASLEPLAQAAGLRMGAELPEEPLIVPMDTSRIERVLINLLSNAIKFTAEGGRITVRARLEGGRLRCEVEDTGIGIPRDDLPKLFQRFGQLPAGTHKGGTGLGLSISKAIVEEHGGAIGVDSEPGRGSTFWFSLPL